MWTPTDVILTNFQGVVKSHVKIRSNQATLIIGENLCDETQESNGAGKSTLGNSICIALTGKPIKSLPVDSFVNRYTDSDTATIQMILTDEANNELDIIRSFSSNSSPSELFITMNGELPILLE